MSLNRQVLRILDQTNEEVERNVDNRLTCRKGCGFNPEGKGRKPGCCHRVVFVTEIEADLIAEHCSLNSIPINEIRAQGQAILSNRPGMTAEKYLQTAGPCIFLDMDTHECTIHEVRPVVCRTMNVISDPANCGSVQRPIQAYQHKEIAYRAMQALRRLSVDKKRQLKIGALPDMILGAIDARAEKKTFDSRGRSQGTANTQAGPDIVS